MPAPIVRRRMIQPHEAARRKYQGQPKGAEGSERVHAAFEKQPTRIENEPARRRDRPRKEMSYRKILPCEPGREGHDPGDPCRNRSRLYAQCPNKNEEHRVQL